jgi:hypothetical protein
VGLLEAVGGLVSAAAGDAVKGVQALWQGIKSVYSFASTIFDLVGDAWSWMVHGIQWLGEQVLGFAAVVLNLFRWVIDVGLPGAAGWAFTHAIEWAKAAVHTAVHAASVAFDDAKAWLLGEIRKVWHELTSDIKAVWGKLTGVWSWLEHEGRRAVSLILHPEALARHLLSAITAPLLRWVLERAPALLVWAAKTSLGLLGEIGPVIEDALEKLL